MEKLYIGIYGSVNSGKSSLINRLAGQDIAIVSARAGTTTDPVKKLIELDGIGRVVLIDSAGINDATELGVLRVAKTMQTLDIVDMAIIVAAAGKISKEDEELIARLRAVKKPFFVVNNKSDKPYFKPLALRDVSVINFSAKDTPDVKEILALIKKIKPDLSQKQTLLDDIIACGDIVVLVTPIDAAAPKDRMILPQVNLIRNVLDNDAVNVVIQPARLADFLKLPVKVKLVVTDSQAFAEVSRIVPPEIPLTSFSILFARFKGNFEHYLNGVRRIDSLQDGDKVLILESCSHSGITCEDIGRVKLPALISKKSGRKLDFKIISGLDPLPNNVKDYALAVQCGGCMATKTQLAARIGKFVDAGVAVSNYGIVIAYCNGILDRVTEIFNTRV